MSLIDKFNVNGSSHTLKTETDKTLTLENFPADAKAVGERINGTVEGVNRLSATAKRIHWNQMVHPIETFYLNDGKGFDVPLDISSGVITGVVNGQTNTYFRTGAAGDGYGVKIVAGHRYYTSIIVSTTVEGANVAVRHSGNSDFRFITATSIMGVNSPYITYWQRLSQVSEPAPTSHNGVYIRYNFNSVTSTVGGICRMQKPWMVDLTEMYGEGNEPTKEEFESLFDLDYYEYNSGEDWDIPGWDMLQKKANKGDCPTFNQVIYSGKINFNQLAKGSVGKAFDNQEVNGIKAGSLSNFDVGTQIRAGHKYYFGIQLSECVTTATAGRAFISISLYYNDGDGNKRFISSDATLDEFMSGRISRGFTAETNFTVTNSGASTTGGMWVYLKLRDTDTISCKVDRFMLVDLTSMYESNEPDVETFALMFPSIYYPHADRETMLVDAPWKDTIRLLAERVVKLEAMLNGTPATLSDNETEDEE